jgi:hypothetical protein
MKRFPRSIQFFAMAIAVLQQTITFAQVPRSDVLECGLPSGEKFILRGSYTYNPIADMLPHAQSISNRKGWFVEYIGANKKIKLDDPWGYYPGKTYGRGDCRELLVYKNRPIVKDRFLNSEEKWERIRVNRDNFLFDASDANKKSAVEKSLTEQKVEPLSEAFMFEESKGVRVYELALRSTAADPVGKNTDPKKFDWRVAAVFQRKSLDDGKTWSDGIITKETLLFELGKTTWDQCFIARPIKFNGEPIEAKFLPCATRP